MIVPPPIISLLPEIAGGAVPGVRANVKKKKRGVIRVGELELSLTWSRMCADWQCLMVQGAGPVDGLDVRFCFVGNIGGNLPLEPCN